MRYVRNRLEQLIPAKPKGKIVFLLWKSPIIIVMSVPNKTYEPKRHLNLHHLFKN